MMMESLSLPEGEYSMLSTNLAILELAKRQRMSPSTYAVLARIAGTGSSLLVAAAIRRRAVQVLAMLLGGLGIIFFIAANWQTHSPIPMFAGLQATLLGACVGAACWPRLRVPLALLGFLATGALLAFFGQYYQSGADPWQMFALWAGLLIPLAFAGIQVCAGYRCMVLQRRRRRPMERREVWRVSGEARRHSGAGVVARAKFGSALGRS
jgi:hypothetical protein